MGEEKNRNMKLVSKSLSSFKYAGLAASVIAFLVIVMGGVVRSTGSLGACPDWPACYGSWLPPLGGGALADYLHRFLTALLAPVILWVVISVWRRYPRQMAISLPVSTSLALIGLQAVSGRLLIFTDPSIQLLLTSAHLGISLITLALLLTSMVVAFYLDNQREQIGLLATWKASPFARLTGFTLIAVFILLATGAVLSGASANVTCLSWPVCSQGSLLPQSQGDWINAIHRLAVVFSAVLVAAQFRYAWRSQRGQTPILVASTAVMVLFFAQALLGWYRTVHPFPVYMIAIHEATASAVWAALMVQAVASRMSDPDSNQLAAETTGRRDLIGLAKDFLLLTKPVVVLLLLVTTYTGMVIGSRAFPPLGLAFWTLLGGAMAAGGSGAINQYIDRFDDRKMQRTEHRPIPSGRLTPGEGLAFGVGLCLASFFLLVTFVNLLSALLSLAGIVYYVLIYSIFLKKTTVQNIVIGGGAGAIPPLVGWAAATGALNIPSLFLFAVVFMWTPPHFWALAIVRRKDYARAGVPMLPVVRGEEEARGQILLYTLELVVLTMLLPLFGLGSSIYLVSAAALGGGLLFYAWRVWRRGGNKVAWMMYRFSSLYLAFLFVALMVDRLVLK
jgi:protoheme IX farnesyltransferase